LRAAQTARWTFSCGAPGPAGAWRHFLEFEKEGKMHHDTAAAQDLLAGPKPVSVEISTRDIQMLYAMRTSPAQFMQLILAKLKDAGAPVEGALNLRLAHGKVFKMKDDPLQEQPSFTYLWLPEAYVDGMRGSMEAGRA
jgi:hypothetical protein